MGEVSRPVAPSSWFHGVQFNLIFHNSCRNIVSIACAQNEQEVATSVSFVTIPFKGYMLCSNLKCTFFISFARQRLGAMLFSSLYNSISIKLQINSIQHQQRTDSRTTTQQLSYNVISIYDFRLWMQVNGYCVDVFPRFYRVGLG